VMTDNQREWIRTRDGLVRGIKALGFPEEPGSRIAKQLGSPKAMSRMMGYLVNVRPRSVELINTIRPDVAIPVHYGHIVGKPGDEEVFADNVMAPIKVEFKIAF